MVLLLAMGATTVGSKSYWKELWSRMVGEQENTVINVEDAEIMESDSIAEVDYYREINDTLNIRIIYPRQIPKAMYLLNYEIDEQLRMAKIFYEYQGKIILYAIYANDIDSSYTEDVPDKLNDTFEVKTDKQQLVVEEYLVEETQEFRYVCYFDYEGIHYQLMGMIDRDDFIKILENLYYF